MNQHKQLREILKPHLGWHGAHLNFVVMFLIALVKVSAVNLTQLALAFGGEAQVSSHYRRLRRFFSEFVLY